MTRKKKDCISMKKVQTPLVMKKTLFHTGHRWTTDELRNLMKMWADEEPLGAIAAAMSCTTAAINKQILRLRENGIPMKKRTKGHKAGRAYLPWTQGEAEYLVRRREEKATCESIAVDLGRTWNAVNAMIGALRKEQVPVAMRGSGVRRLWDAEALKMVATQHGQCKIIELDSLKIA